MHGKGYGGGHPFPWFGAPAGGGFDGAFLGAGKKAQGHGGSAVFVSRLSDLHGAGGLFFQGAGL